MLGRRLWEEAGLLAFSDYVLNGQRSYGAGRAQDRLAYEPFTAARLAALGAAGKSVFVNLTADRCVTCLINERVALDSAGVREAFVARGIVALKATGTTATPKSPHCCSNSAAAASPSTCSMVARAIPSSCRSS